MLTDTQTPIRSAKQVVHLTASLPCFEHDHPTDEECLIALYLTHEYTILSGQHLPLGKGCLRLRERLPELLDTLKPPTKDLITIRDHLCGGTYPALGWPDHVNTWVQLCRRRGIRVVDHITRYPNDRWLSYMGRYDRQGSSLWRT